LTNTKTSLSSQSDELTKLDTKFSLLQAAVQKVGTALGGAAFQTSVSSDNVVGVSVADGAQEGVYSINVKSIGAYEASLSTQNWNVAKDPSGNPTTFTLVVGSQNYSVTPADNSIKSVVDAINSNYGNLVQATTVNVAPGDTRISLKSVALGQTTLDIQTTTGTSFQTEQSQGALASYEMNNSGVTNTSTTRNITVSNGVTATLLGTSGTPSAPVDITVMRSTSALGTALSGLADAYNAAVDELGAQRGQSSGALSGHFVVSQLSSLLSSISTYSSGGEISGLKSLGLDLGSDGHLTYDGFALMAANLTSSTSVAAFLGSATGGGFLKNATDALTSVEDPTAGLLKTSETDMQSQIAKLGTTISKKQDQVDQLQIRLQTQMAAADALIAAMEQQSSYFSSMFAAQQTANQMYK
jgi:flagellar hook-associated protein 2